MKLDTKTLLIGGILIGGFFWYRNRQKSQALASASESSETKSSSSGGSGGGGGGFSSGGSVSTPLITPTAVIVNQPARRPSYEPITRESGTILNQVQSLPTTPTTPTTAVSTNTQLKSKFLTFDGNNKPASTLFFDGNID
jgi:hypothetical protein